LLGNNRRTAFTLRPQSYAPTSFLAIAKIFDESAFTNLFIIDTPKGFEPIEMSASLLAVSNRLRIGSGVIRLLQHDESLLQRRIETLQALSTNRFVFGIGIEPMSTPPHTISGLLTRLESIKRKFEQSANSKVFMPDTYIATLKKGIAKKVAGHSTGILMNSCSALYAKDMVHEVESVYHHRLDFSSYIRVFFSKEKQKADRQMLQEFIKFDSANHYHEMFKRDGISEAIGEAKSILGQSTNFRVPEALSRVSTSNPSLNELREFVNTFRESGITLPSIYPSFPDDEDEDFKLRTLKEIAKF
jgi:hypothetical protein